MHGSCDGRSAVVRFFCSVTGVLWQLRSQEFFGGMVEGGADWAPLLAVCAAVTGVSDGVAEQIRLDVAECCLGVCC